MRSTLLYNPAAGRHREQRCRLVEQVASRLRERGFAVEVEATRNKGGAQQQSMDAVARGAEAMFACGGDGTVHDVLQGVVGADVLLGVVPAGSANALAQELRLPRDPLRAAEQFSPLEFVRVPTTVVERSGFPPLYSLCMAGAGPDGLLMYRMLAVSRSRLGRWRYYEHALRIFLTHRFEPFHVEVQNSEGTATVHRVVSAMALRIGDMQGIFAGIARGAALHGEALHVILVSPPARLTLPLWFFLSWLRLSRFHPGITVSKALRLRTDGVVPLQVDGEWAGHTRVTIAANGPMQRLLVPRELRSIQP